MSLSSDWVGGSGIVRPTHLACWQHITLPRLKLTWLGRGASKLGHDQQLPSDAPPDASQNMRYAQAGDYSQPCFNHRLLYYFSETEVISETQSSARSTHESKGLQTLFMLLFKSAVTSKHYKIGSALSAEIPTIAIGSLIKF